MAVGSRLDKIAHWKPSTAVSLQRTEWSSWLRLELPDAERRWCSHGAKSGSGFQPDQIVPMDSLWCHPPVQRRSCAGWLRNECRRYLLRSSTETKNPAAAAAGFHEC